MLRGIVPVIPTPFTEQEDLDLLALRRLVDFAVRSRVPAICLPAYGGEFYKLTDSERFSVVKTAIEQADGRVLVIAQSNHGCTQLVEEVARRNEALGADVISFALPRQFALPEEELLRFSEKICKAISVPALSKIQSRWPECKSELRQTIARGGRKFSLFEIGGTPWRE